MQKEYGFKVGIIGATGAIGQNYVKLLEKHPWFEVSYVAASPSSAGKKYSEVAGAKWIEGHMPENVKNLVLGDATYPDKALGKCDFVFFAAELPKKEDIANLEFYYAANGFPVISNNSANRWTHDVPMIIPEINHDHADIIPYQRKTRGFSTGFVAVKPNCSIQSFLIQIHALKQAGYHADRLVVTTEQALSGAGYPGVPSLDILDNVMPYIGGEEEKTRTEPLKIFGSVDLEHGIKPCSEDDLMIDATCTRVNVMHGHTAIVNMGFKGEKPSLDKIINIWADFEPVHQIYGFPTFPNPVLIYTDAPNRPQPRLDRDSGNGMAITSGRLEKGKVLDYRFIGLSHNTIRGAAGGAILTAELLTRMNYINKL